VFHELVKLASVIIDWLIEFISPFTVIPIYEPIYSIDDNLPYPDFESLSVSFKTARAD